MIPVIPVQPKAQTPTAQPGIEIVEVELHMLPVLGPLFQARIEESKLEHRLTMDRALDKTHYLIETKQGAAFADSLLLPTLAIILQTGHSVIFEEKFCNVILLYVKKEERSTRKALVAGRFIEDYARRNGCDVINGDSWVYRGGEDIGPLWKHLGFEQQAVSWVKHLK